MENLTERKIFGLSVWAIIGIVAGIVLLLIVIIFILWIRRRTKIDDIEGRTEYAATKIRMTPSPLGPRGSIRTGNLNPPPPSPIDLKNIGPSSSDKSPPLPIKTASPSKNGNNLAFNPGWGKIGSAKTEAKNEGEAPMSGSKFYGKQ